MVIALKWDMHPRTEMWDVSRVEGIWEASGCEEMGCVWCAVVKMMPGRVLVNFDGRWYSSFADSCR